MTGALTYTEAISGTLRREFGPLRHAVKVVARLAGKTPRAVENWFAGLCGPQGEALIDLMAGSPAVTETVLRLVAARLEEGAAKSAALKRRHAAILRALSEELGGVPGRGAGAGAGMDGQRIGGCGRGGAGAERAADSPGPADVPGTGRTPAAPGWGEDG